MNYVYLLRCSDDTLYCGWTTDLTTRIDAHNSGKADERKQPYEHEPEQGRTDRAGIPAMRELQAIRWIEGGRK